MNYNLSIFRGVVAVLVSPPGVFLVIIHFIALHFLVRKILSVFKVLVEFGHGCPPLDQASK
jgi:hypothetical protein